MQIKVKILREKVNKVKILRVLILKVVTLKVVMLKAKVKGRAILFKFHKQHKVHDLIILIIYKTRMRRVATQNEKKGVVYFRI